MDFTEVFFTSLFFGVPAAMVIWFIISLILTLITPKENTEKRRKRKIMTIVSGVIAGVFVLTIGGLMLMLILAIANM